MTVTIEHQRIGTLLVQEADLAWALAEAVKPYVSTVERNHVFMAIGAGETFAAIRGLFKSVAIKRIALRPNLDEQCGKNWLWFLIPISWLVLAGMDVGRR